MIKQLLKAFSALLALLATVWAGAARADNSDAVSALLQAQLAKAYPEAKVEITSTLHLTRGKAIPENPVVHVLNETARGEVVFSVTGESAADYAEGYATFSAWTEARVAIRRIHPGETLTPDLFVSQNVNVAQGMAREYRGVILEKGESVSGLQSRQTILEGQLLTSSAVERTPDLRRGDTVQIHLINGAFELSTLGVAEEPAYLGGNVRVMASKTKRELVGLLRKDGVVEVKL
jgi:flagella basal body P-ring formation protein FlgA